MYPVGTTCLVIRLTSFKSDPSPFSDMLKGFKRSTTALNSLTVSSDGNSRMQNADDAFVVQTHTFTMRSAGRVTSVELKQYLSKTCGFRVRSDIALSPLCTLLTYSCAWSESTDVNGTEFVLTANSPFLKSCYR